MVTPRRSTRAIIAVFHRRVGHAEARISLELANLLHNTGRKSLYCRLYYQQLDQNNLGRADGALRAEGGVSTKIRLNLDVLATYSALRYDEFWERAGAEGRRGPTALSTRYSGACGANSTRYTLQRRLQRTLHAVAEPTEPLTHAARCCGAYSAAEVPPAYE